MPGPGQVYRNPRTGAPVAEPIGWFPSGARGPDGEPLSIGQSIEDWAGTLPERQMAQIEGRKYVDPREQRDPIALPPVKAPGLFGGGGDPSADLAAKAAEGLRLAQEPVQAYSPGDSMAADMAKARAGFSFKGTPDWGAERSSFLAAGNARREAEDVEAQRLGRQALFPGGRTAGDALSADVAFRKLQQARQELDPAYQREQELRDASTFMDPRMVQRRQMQQQEGITEQKRLRELALSLGLDPKALFLGELEHKRKMELARVAAEGRYSGGLFGKLGASAGIPRGTADAGELTEAEIIQAAQQENWSEEELQSVLRQFRQGGG